MRQRIRHDGHETQAAQLLRLGQAQLLRLGQAQLRPSAGCREGRPLRRVGVPYPPPQALPRGIPCAAWPNQMPATCATSLRLDRPAPPPLLKYSGGNTVLRRRVHGSAPSARREPCMQRPGAARQRRHTVPFPGQDRRSDRPCRTPRPHRRAPRRPLAGGAVYTAKCSERSRRPHDPGRTCGTPCAAIP